jgi:hypothetical protein
VLAAALAQKRHWWLGPIRVRLDDLVRLAGPGPDSVVRVAPEEWEDDVEEMRESLDQGWEPPPLLAEYRGTTGPGTSASALRIRRLGFDSLRARCRYLRKRIRC